VGLKNFGDILNPYIIRHLSSKKIINVRSDYCVSEHLLAIGSVLDRATKNSIIWGSGFISEKSRFVEAPKKVLAVRGPKTRQLLIDQNIECPDIFGDPALLLPEIFRKEKTKEYELGIIPHYIDKDNIWLKSLSKSVKIIDIQDADPFNVVEQILQCENIISSSLHGLIIADAYNIPSLWVKLSEKITGGNFKFQDYYQSIKDDTTKPFEILQNTTIDLLLKQCKIHEINLNLQPLINAFPESYK
jgi:pyruvyltransferase